MMRVDVTVFGPVARRARTDVGQDKEARRVDAVFGPHRLWFDTVEFGFAHLLPGHGESSAGTRLQRLRTR